MPRGDVKDFVTNQRSASNHHPAGTCPAVMCKILSQVADQSATHGGRPRGDENTFVARCRSSSEPRWQSPRGISPPGLSRWICDCLQVLVFEKNLHGACPRRVTTASARRQSKRNTVKSFRKENKVPVAVKHRRYNWLLPYLQRQLCEQHPVIFSWAIFHESPKEFRSKKHHRHL